MELGGGEGVGCVRAVSLACLSSLTPEGRVNIFHMFMLTTLDVSCVSSGHPFRLGMGRQLNLVALWGAAQWFRRIRFSPQGYPLHFQRHEELNSRRAESMKWETTMGQ